jgi:hypothetical protein
MPAGPLLQQRSNAVEGGKTSAKPRAQYIRLGTTCGLLSCDHVARRAYSQKKVSKRNRDAHFAIVSSPSFSFIMQAQAAKPQEVNKY